MFTPETYLFELKTSAYWFPSSFILNKSRNSNQPIGVCNNSKFIGQIATYEINKNFTDCIHSFFFKYIK